MTSLEALREDLLTKQKKGLPFILASCVLWALISVVCALDIPVMTRNVLVFCCACPLFPLAILIGKIIGVNVLEKENPLSKLLILGRVTSGSGGELIIETGRKILAEEYPALAEKIELRVPDEQFKRHGQAVIAASLPEIG